MTPEEQIYRILHDISEVTDDNRSVHSNANAIANAAEGDRVVVFHNVCRVAEDWVAAIERGLVYIGRAIGEDRQFIRSNGEVQPIEKVRHVSRESVQHLSRHSDFISREQKQDIVPDKLYTVERLNDYAVYENRFLYVLLCRIRDFVAVRYDAIMHAYRLYRGELKSKKTLTIGTRRLQYEFTLTDEQDEVFAAAADTECKSYLDRIEKIQQSVVFYMRTPLMVEVARVDKIKRLTKTNVLRMDKNFREAVTLYEFLLNYDKDGYTIRRRKRDLNPVGAEAAHDLALPALFSAFLVYEHGLGIEKYCEMQYQREQARREELKKQALAEEIKALKKRVEETGTGMEEYMLKLEERVAVLEKDSALLAEARMEIETLNGTVERMKSEAEELHKEIGELDGKNKKLLKDMERAEEEHRRKVEEMTRAHAEEISALKTAHNAAIHRLNEEHAEAVRAAEQGHREEMARLRTEFEKRAREGLAVVSEKDRELTSLRGEMKSLTGERDVLAARVTAMRSEQGMLGAGDDFTTEEGFNALEHEYEVLGRLVRDKWSDVKKMLKKEFFRSLRTTMRPKKGQKSEEYKKLCEETQARQARAQEQKKGKKQTAAKQSGKQNGKQPPQELKTKQDTEHGESVDGRREDEEA